MRKQAYRPLTIWATLNALKSVAKRANLLEPESVKEWLGKASVSDNRKHKIVQDLARFYRWKCIHFDAPNYKRTFSLPFIPLETEIDQLISGVGKKTSTFLQLLKETGMRAGEAWQLKWSNIDLEGNCVSITPEKGSNPRQLRLSGKLLAMMNALPKKNDYIFQNGGTSPESSLRSFTARFEKNRRQVAEKLQNPRIKSIKFHTLRHWKATTLYHKTKDILLVKETLGHRSLTSTLVYTHLVNFESEDDFVCKAVRTVEEAKSLIETGFEFVTDFQEFKLFRKRK